MRVSALPSLGVLGAASWLAIAPGCGARSSLELPEACFEQGLTRACFDACGEGTQVCSNGYWQACEVAETERPCSNDCGEGFQRCSAGAWGACQVPVSERSCSNDCGQGVQQCRDGAWGICDVPVATRDCTNDCGSGMQECRDGRWQSCQVPVTSRPCSDICGSGTQSCVDGAWQKCEVPDVFVECASVCGTGHEICRDGVWLPCNAPQPGPPKLVSTIRDFTEAHPDFEEPAMGVLPDLGIVAEVLGPDDKPVYLGNPRTATTSGREAFDQWYRDTPGVNLSAVIDLQLRPSPNTPGLFVYESNAFFPIDNQLFGNEGNPHNYHFTLEARTEFDYIGGEVFSFTGDDDMWVFINRRLAIDLGGLHTSLSASVNLDQEADRLGLIKGQRYPLHFFFAERHTIESNFTIRTSIAESGSCE